MSDKVTTLRSDYYKRPYPDTGYDPTNPEEVAKRMAKAKANAKVRLTSNNLFKPFKNIKDEYWPSSDLREQNVKALLATNPELEPLLRQVALARIKMLNSDDKWTKSKKYGWGHRIDYPMPPDADEYFSYREDPETGELYIDDSDKVLDFLLPNGEYNDEYKSRRKPFEDYLTHQMKHVLEPMTREEAEKNGYAWYPSTYEILNALAETQYGEGNKRALYDATQRLFSQLMLEDSDKETPEYEKAWSRILNDDGEQETQFEAPNGVWSTAKNMVIPFTNAVLEDPELWAKTNTIEALARGGTDALLNAASVALPWAGAARGATMASRPVLGAMLGGAIGGGANYALGRGANEGYDFFTGHGGIEYPIDLTDAGLEVGLGSLGGLGASANRVRGMGRLKKIMSPDTPKRVKNSDIDKSIELVEKHGTKADAEWPFRSSAFDEYESKYPDAGTLVHVYPKLQVKVNDEFGKRTIPLAQGLPSGKATNTGRKTGHGANANKYVKGDNPDVEMPVEYARPDSEFMSKWVEQNKTYFDGKQAVTKPGVLRLNDWKDIAKAAKQAQEKDNPMAKLFSGGFRFYPDKDFKGMLASFSGQHFDDETNAANRAVANMIRKNHRAINFDGSRWHRAGKEQSKLKDKATEDYARRSSFNLVSKEDKKKAFSNDGVKRYKIPALLGTAIGNAIPWGSNVILGVNPYEYYAPTETDANNTKGGNE